MSDNKTTDEKRNYIQVTEETRKRIRVFAAEHDLAMPWALKKLVDAGLEAMAKKESKRQ